jgi:uncharacterized repeat protein (TIGR03803 family)
VVFERTSGGSYSVRYNLCAQTNCADGAKPEAGVIVDGSGNLFGTTAAGGNGNDAGTVYEISGSTESVLYSFCSQQTCTDGYEPVAGLTMDPSGGLLGTTYAGGTHGLGEVFRLGP